MTSPLISVQDLYSSLDTENIVILDASRKPDLDNSIPKARHFDIKNSFSDSANKLPNTFPSAEQFQEACRALGINTTSKIIVFDNEGIFTSPRVWFMFIAFGHDNIHILNGGLSEWQRCKFPTSSMNKDYKAGDFKADLLPASVLTYGDVCQNIPSEEYVLIDARSNTRFMGTSPEPRPHIKSGHIKNSLNLPYTEVLENGKYKSKKELKQVIDALGLQEKLLAFSCGSGITACIILVAFSIVYPSQYSIYDGSWTEWAEREKLFNV